MFKVGQLIRPRGTGSDNQDLYTIVYMNSNYIQAVNMKQSAYISIPRSAQHTYKVATDRDIESFLSRYLKYHIIQNYSDNGKWKVSSKYVGSI